MVPLGRRNLEEARCSVHLALDDFSTPTDTLVVETANVQTRVRAITNWCHVLLLVLVNTNVPMTIIS